MDVLAWGWLVRQWSINLFRRRLLCTAVEHGDVAGGRRAVEDNCYLEQSIRMVWAHHSGHVYLPAWTALPQGGRRNMVLFLYFGKRLACHSQIEIVGKRSEQRWRRYGHKWMLAVFFHLQRSHSPLGHCFSVSSLDIVPYHPFQVTFAPGPSCTTGHRCTPKTNSNEYHLNFWFASFNNFWSLLCCALLITMINKRKYTILCNVGSLHGVNLATLKFYPPSLICLHPPPKCRAPSTIYYNYDCSLCA